MYAGTLYAYCKSKRLSPPDFPLLGGADEPGDATENWVSINRVVEVAQYFIKGLDYYRSDLDIVKLEKLNSLTNSPPIPFVFFSIRLISM